MMEAGRGSKGPMDDRTLGPTGTWEQVKDGKGEQSDRGSKVRIVQGTPLGRLAGEESADERWRPAGGSAVQVDGRSANGQERGEEAGAKIERSGVDG